MRASTAFVALWLTAIGDARQAPQQPPRFRSEVEVVELDISVVDNNRRPVRGLTAADFSVLEDGQPQSIVQFTAVDITDPPPTPTTWLRDVAPDVKDNSVADRRVFVILLDDAMIPGDPGMIQSTKKIARGLVNRLGPSDLAAVVFTLNDTHAQDFTSDRARLLAAIDTFAPGFRGFAPPPPPIAAGRGELAGAPFLPDKNVDTYYYLSSVNALNKVAELLTDVPHQRKVLMYVSVGVPVSASMPILAMGQDAGSGIDSHLHVLMADLFRLARLSNVNVYSFDPGGLDGLANYFLGHKDYRPDAVAHRQYLQEVAENTGGRAIVDTNDVDRGVSEMMRESGSYYLLAYQSSNPQKDGTFRKVDVRVNRPGVIVRTRNGYNAPRAAKEGSTKPPPSAVETAVAGLLPRSDVQMQVAIAPFAIPGKSEVALAIAADVRQPVPNERTTDDIELLTRAFGPEGQPRGSQKQIARVVLRPSEDPEAQFEVLSRLDLKPGRYNLRLAAHSTLQDKTGSVSYAIDVPDFSKDALSLSGIVIATTPATASAGKEALAALIPVMPTTRRTFATTDSVAAFLRIYQHARGTLSSVRLDIRVVDDHDAANFHATEIVSADRFDVTRTVDHRFDLPIGSFAPGPHLLTIEATAGRAAARRDVRFVVR